MDTNSFMLSTKSEYLNALQHHNNNAYQLTYNSRWQGYLVSQSQ